MKSALGLALVVTLTAPLVTSRALAAPSTDTPPSEDGARALAKASYERGVLAHKQGDFLVAARAFADADALAPSPVALKAALDAAIDADAPALGMELVERVQALGKAPPPLATSAANARRKFAHRAGRVRVSCAASQDCSATLDGEPLAVGRASWVTTGEREIELVVDGRPRRERVVVRPKGVAEVAPRTEAEGDVGAATEAAASLEPAAPESTDGRRRLPPIVFYAGVGATAAMAGLTTFLALQTKQTHDEFESLGCARTALSDCATLKDDGEARQTATNVSLAFTGVFAVATAVVGAGFTRWNGPLVGALPGGGAAFAWSGSFH